MKVITGVAVIGFGLQLCGCSVVSAVDTAVSVTGSVVSGAASVVSGTVEGIADLAGGGSSSPPVAPTAPSPTEP